MRRIEIESPVFARAGGGMEVERHALAESHFEVADRPAGRQPGNPARKAREVEHPRRELGAIAVGIVDLLHIPVVRLHLHRAMLVLASRHSSGGPRRSFGIALDMTGPPARIN